MKFLNRYKLEILMVLPLVLYVFGFSLLPVLQTINMSFVDPASSQLTFSNYRYIFEQKGFNEAFFNTIFITIFGLVFQLVLALILALILRKSFWGRGFFRTIMLVPLGVPTIVSGITMLYIFSTNGYLNEFLQRIDLITTPIVWNAERFTAIMMIVLADTWKVLPITVLILLAGLESIPNNLYEASAMDGASTWRTFWNVTLPLLKPSITMAIILRAIDAFRIFELPLVLAGRNTPVLTVYAYDEYRRFNNYNTSAAASTILLIIIVVFIFFYFWFVERKEKE